MKPVIADSLVDMQVNTVGAQQLGIGLQNLLNAYQEEGIDDLPEDNQQIVPHVHVEDDVQHMDIDCNKIALLHPKRPTYMWGWYTISQFMKKSLRNSQSKE